MFTNKKCFFFRFYILCENFSKIGPIINKIPKFWDPLKWVLAKTRVTRLMKYLIGFYLNNIPNTITVCISANNLLPYHEYSLSIFLMISIGSNQAEEGPFLYINNTNDTKKSLVCFGLFAASWSYLPYHCTDTTVLLSGLTSLHACSGCSSIRSARGDFLSYIFFSCKNVLKEVVLFIVRGSRTWTDCTAKTLQK